MYFVEGFVHFIYEVLYSMSL